MFCSNLAHFICRGTVFQVQGRMRLPVDAGDNSVIGVCVRLFDSFVLFYATPIYYIAMPKAIFCRKKRNATADFSLFVTQIRDFFCKFAPNKNEIGRRGCMICSSPAVAIQ